MNHYHHIMDKNNWILSQFWGHGSAYFRKDNTGSNAGNAGNYTVNSGYNNGKNTAGGYSGSFNAGYST